ncbi:zinc finger BED domain-containing protein RICESLEEPER 1-like [Amaranthus tricolor]|uniref:zinc finger BED domain-containing protein RICESLEEPER 1-like n=1 Tax=Amaranthus tricolor TaxID=29722 RepID=UPI0025836188|nr:zinc finger BED domain-containing protein RICESLEEPER 1-like [Amaranthus tricolor]XP_057522084.1 zinc finger BED domain-containing protein RICESLEEPER 1-like [Amaranthus tricolor]XP_057522091.1 zinc finger BED domain-containing protein RICESLEEPER 1-like [Amaranthus tricolor]
MEITSETVIKKPKRLTSVVWNHFERVKKADICYAVCVHCSKRLSGSSNSGTTHLRNHLMRCLKRSNFDVSQLLAKRRKKDNTVTLSSYNFDEGQSKDDHIPVAAIKFETEPKREEAISTGSSKFDQKRSRMDLARMVILHGYPLAMVDDIGFKVFVKNLQPMFDIATNSALELDCIAIYEKEKQNVYTLISRLRGRVSVAVDLWNSPEDARYLCLTAHYIDEEWKQQKKILNFMMIDAAHTEDIHSEVVIKCLMDWDIERRLFSMTFGDLFTRDDIVSRIKDHLSQNRPLLSDGKLFDVRCAAHTLKLLVGDAMDSIRDVIHKIREGICYVKSTQIMQGKFNELAQQAGIDNQRNLLADCSMRWNSTSAMLETALAYKAAFTLLQKHDSSCTLALSEEEWEWANSVTSYLKLFVEITNAITSNNSPTSNIYFPEICDVHVQLIEWCKSSDEFIKCMALKMKAKFEVYWNKCSLLLAIAAILDPRFKMKLVEYYYPQIYGDSAEDRIKEVSDGIRDLFNEYSIGSMSVSIEHGVGSSSGGVGFHPRDRLKGFDEFLHETSQGKNSASDLDKYLEEPVFPRNYDFNIFTWWKVHTPRYPILSMMAQDILCVPMSTATPELAFRTGGRVLDHYRSSLSSDTVQALICTQDWLQSDVEGERRER